MPSSRLPRQTGKVNSRSRPSCMKTPTVRVYSNTYRIINPRRSALNRRLRSERILEENSPPLSPDLPFCAFCHMRAYPTKNLKIGPLFGPYWTSDREEIWVHLSCVLWVPCITLMCGTLQGLEEGLAQCRLLKCHICNNYGASMGCVHHRCKAAIHPVCDSKGIGWKSDENNLLAYCPSHCF